MSANIYKENDILVFKKNHPCGGNSWKVLRVGVDYKLECTTCKRIIIILRYELNKMVKKTKEWFLCFKLIIMI